MPTRGSNHSRDCDWGFPSEGVEEAILCVGEREFAQHREDAVVVVLVVCRVLDVQGGSRQVLGAAVVGEIAGKCRGCRVQANAAQSRAERWLEAKSD